jgi:hypothetical protein
LRAGAQCCALIEGETQALVVLQYYVLFCGILYPDLFVLLIPFFPLFSLLFLSCVYPEGMVKLNNVATQLYL